MRQSRSPLFRPASRQGVRHDASHLVRVEVKRTHLARSGKRDSGDVRVNTSPTPVSSVRGPPLDLECPGEHRRLTGGGGRGIGQAAGLGVGVPGRLVTLVAVDGCIFRGFDAFDELFEQVDLVG